MLPGPPPPSSLTHQPAPQTPASIRSARDRPRSEVMAAPECRSPRIPRPSGVRARGTPVPGKAASIRSLQAAKSRPQFSAHRQRTSCGKKQSALSSHASQIHIAPNNYQLPQQDDMAFSPRAAAKFMKRLGTTLRQTKCEKVENPPPLLDYFPTHWVLVSVAMKNALSARTTRTIPFLMRRRE
jgi:hypothetical protein